MKSFAELKRTIKPGLTLKCIANTYRPQLNGSTRTVTRIQTNGFWWIDSRPHELRIISIQDANANCTCGDWRILFPVFDYDDMALVRERIESDFNGHRYRAKMESWTEYPKAAGLEFDGAKFKMRMWASDPKMKDHYIELEVLAS